MSEPPEWLVAPQGSNIASHFSKQGNKHLSRISKNATGETPAHGGSIWEGISSCQYIFALKAKI